MAQRRTTPPRDERPPKLRVPRLQVEEQLTERIRKGQEIRGRPIASPDELEGAKQDYYTWDEVNYTLLENLFDTRAVAEKYRGLFFGGIDPRDFNTTRKFFLDGVASSVRRLSSIIESRQYYDEPADQTPPTASIRRAPDHGSDIFIVHGHDEAAKQAVARFVEHLGLLVKILQDLPSTGMTLIEKLERHAEQVGFAIVLLTPDDLGADRSHQADLQPRARQNVVLELGYFLGKIGRARVCALYSESVELPSDFAGVLYVPLDAAGAWSLLLAREMRQAGIDVDLNRAL